ncbi:hypothetical protein ACQP2P_31275 [Dactylosporangium sp. CA-139114]|uniref:hypothetical protein n=1 Tax=Dactylosporangium sp. CA-139114 TaxID=3239931 RepID=UPI003D997EE1
MARARAVELAERRREADLLAELDRLVPARARQQLLGLGSGNLCAGTTLYLSVNVPGALKSRSRRERSRATQR